MGDDADIEALRVFFDALALQIQSQLDYELTQACLHVCLRVSFSLQNI